jgi:hypothetical protein
MKRKLCICIQQWVLGNCGRSSSHDPEDGSCMGNSICKFSRPHMREDWDYKLDADSTRNIDCTFLPIVELRKGQYDKLVAEYRRLRKLRRGVGCK